MKKFCFDLDGTIFCGESLPYIAKNNGLWEEYQLVANIKPDETANFKESDNTKEEGYAKATYLQKMKDPEKEDEKENQEDKDEVKEDTKKEVREKVKEDRKKGIEGEFEDKHKKEFEDKKKEDGEEKIEGDTKIEAKEKVREDEKNRDKEELTDKGKEVLKGRDIIREDEIIEVLDKYKPNLLKRIAALSSVSVKKVVEDIRRFPVNESIVRFIKTHKEQCVVITSNLDCWVGEFLNSLECEYYTSKAIVKNGYIERVESVLDKESIIIQYKEKGYEVVFTGDGLNDKDAMEVSDISVAFLASENSWKRLAQVCDYQMFDQETLMKLFENWC